MQLRHAASGAALVLAALLATGAPAGAASRVAVLRTENVAAAAFSGVAVVVARHRDRGGVAVELHAPGAVPRRVFLLRGDRFSQGVRVAASPQAVAISVLDRTGDGSTSRVVVGPPAGPLREVARCPKALAAPPVAADGSRVAWSDGACAVPVNGPREVLPGTVAVADVDPGVPVRRIAVPEERLPTSLALGAAEPVAGLLRAALVSFYGGELRRAEGDRLGPALAGGAGAAVDAIGTAPGDVAVVLRNRQVQFEFTDGEPRGCPLDLLTVAPAPGAARRRLRLGRCVVPNTVFDDDSLLFASPVDTDGIAVTAGDRVAARTARGRPHPASFEFFGGHEGPVDLRSAAAGGGDVRVEVRSSRHRALGDLVGGSGRVGWVQPRCVGGQQIRTLDMAAPAGRPETILDCRADLLTRRARVRGGAIRVRIRCPRGCKGRVVDQSICTGETSRAFRFGRGVHTLRLRLTSRARRVGRALIQVRVEAGPDRRRTVRLARRAA